MIAAVSGSSRRYQLVDAPTAHICSTTPLVSQMLQSPTSKRWPSKHSEQCRAHSRTEFFFVMLRFLPCGWLPLLLFSLFAAIDLVLSSGCYYAYNSTILPSPDYVDPCGTVTSANAPFLDCCALQSNNVCLSNSICYDPNRVAYYLSPCTDQSYSAPECPQYCSEWESDVFGAYNGLTFRQQENRVDKNHLDVTYDSDNHIWQCCSTSDDGSSSNCSHPTDESFAAPAPDRLLTIYPAPSSNPTIPPSSKSTIPPSSKSTNPPSSSASPFQSHSNVTSSAPRTSSLSTGDIIALSVGVPSTIATLVGVVFAYKTWQRKSKRSQPVANQARGRRP